MVSQYTVLLLLLFLLWSRLAYAYLDPGTGSYIFQIIIAALIGGLYAIKLKWKKIKLFVENLLSRMKKNG